MEDINNLEEGIKVTIEEEPEPVEEKIKELVYEFHLINNYETGMQTEKINGKLLAMIITSDKPVHIQITSADNPNMIIYEKVDYIGSYYLPILITAVSKSANQFNYIAQPYYLNEVLNIVIKGQIDSRVKVQIRWCSD